MARNCIVVVALLLMIFLPVRGAYGQEVGKSLLVNGELNWNGGELSNWQIGVGNGQGRPESTVRESDEGALEFSGSAETQTWNFVGQDFEASAGDCLLFSYTAMSNGIRRDPGQNRNCYAAIWFKNERGNIGNSFYTISDEKFTSHQHVVHVPEGTTKCSAMMFLSMTGTLQFKQVGVRSLSADESFDVLVSQMDRYYSYFQHKEIDWVDLTDRYRQRAREATDAKDFGKVVLEMLAELKDGHIWLMKNGNRVPAWFAPRPRLNFDFSVVDKQLTDVERFGRMGLIGKTADNLCYIRITSLQGQPADIKPVIDSVENMFGTDGMIIDLRANGGGNELLGRALAGLFCKETTQYAINRFRKNENHDEFIEYPRGPIEPHSGNVYDKPVVCLIGPGAVSSAEGTALMFSALPNVTMMGQATRGSSGNPAPVVLPNGVEVWFSRWVACDTSGEPIEDRGVQPDIFVEHTDGDATWERAKAELAK